jgi:hypothetical protein
MKQIFFCGVLILLIGTTSYAQQAGVILMGAGTNSCGRWLEKRTDPLTHYQQAQWVYGFVSGINWASWSAGKEQAKPLDFDAAVAFIDQYCRNNPLDPLVSAAAALVQETGGPKAFHKWKR